MKERNNCGSFFFFFVKLTLLKKIYLFIFLTVKMKNYRFLLLFALTIERVTAMSIAEEVNFQVGSGTQESTNNQPAVSVHRNEKFP